MPRQKGATESKLLKLEEIVTTGQKSEEVKLNPSNVDAGDNKV